MVLGSLKPILHKAQRSGSSGKTKFPFRQAFAYLGSSDKQRLRKSPADKCHWSLPAQMISYWKEIVEI